jgi:hypothetical protein
MSNITNETGRVDWNEARGRGDQSIETTAQIRKSISGSEETEGAGAHSRNEPKDTRGGAFTKKIVKAQPGRQKPRRPDITLRRDVKVMAGVSNQNGTRRSDQKL